MSQYLMAVVLACTTIGLSLMLVSKKRHCFGISHLAIYLLFFMCVLSIQPAGMTNQGFSFFCGIIMAGCVGIFFWDRFGGKKRYLLKDIDLSQSEHLSNLQQILKEHVRNNLPLTARVDLTYRILTIAAANDAQRESCVKVIDDYMNAHQECSNIKDWRLMIFIAAGVLVLAMILQVIYYLVKGFPA